MPIVFLQGRGHSFLGRSCSVAQQSPLAPASGQLPGQHSHPWGAAPGVVPVPPGSLLWPAADCATRCSCGLTGLRALLEPEHPGLPWGPDPWSIPVSLASPSSHLSPGLSQKCLLPPPE